MTPLAPADQPALRERILSILDVFEDAAIDYERWIHHARDRAEAKAINRRLDEARERTVAALLAMLEVEP